MEDVMGMLENRDAQFMLLAGFIAAVALVIITMTLNNIIFQGNMAITAGTDPSKDKMVNLMQIASDEVRNAYRNSTAAGGSGAQNNFSKQMRNTSASLARIYAMHGEGINMSWDASNWNNGRYANFTRNGTANGAANWTVVESVRNSTIRVNVTNPGTFKINVTGQSNYELLEPSYSLTKTITNVTPPYSIIFINGDSSSGNYSITGNTTYGVNFIRARDYVLNSSVTYSNSRVRINITIPVSVPW